MSKTPRTDEIVKKYKDSPWLIAAQLALLASDLEQQLNDAMAERDGWKEAAYSLGEALPPSWEELQPPAEQLRKFKEMVALENSSNSISIMREAAEYEFMEDNKFTLDVTPQKPTLGPNYFMTEASQRIDQGSQTKETKKLLDNADKHSKLYS